MTVDHRAKLRRLRILQHLDSVHPGPMGERGLLSLLAADPELDPTLERVRAGLHYLQTAGLVELITVDHVAWVAGRITERGLAWLADPDDQGLDIYSPGYQPEVPPGNAGHVSSVDRLPPETRAWVDQALIARGFSGYSDLAELLDQQGLAISRSALGRYGKRLKARVAQYKEKAEVIRALSDVFEQDAPAIMQGAIGSALTAVMDAIEYGDYNTGKESLSSLVATLPRLGRGMQDAERQKIAREARAAAIEKGAAIIEETAAAQGMDADQARFWREKFLKGM